MAFSPVLITAAKAFIAFWSLITLAVAAALMASLNDRFGMSNVSATNLASGSAIIATGVFCLLYFSAAVFLIYRKPDTILISVLVDTIVLGFLFILSLGSTAGLSSVAEVFRDCGGDSICGLGNGTLAVAWILTLMLLALLIFEVTWTLLKYGGAMSTWKTPFNELLRYGHPASSNGISSTSAPGAGQVPMTTIPGQAQYATGVTAPAGTTTGQAHPAAGYAVPQDNFGAPATGQHVGSSTVETGDLNSQATHATAPNTGSIRALPSTPGDLGAAEMGAGSSSGAPVTAPQQLSEKNTHQGRPGGPVTQ